MMGSFGNASRNTLTMSPTPLLNPCAVETATTSTPRSTRPPTWFKIRVAVQFAKRIARGAHRRAAQQAELRIARRLELRLALLLDAFHVAQRDQPVQMIVLVHHQQLVDADVLGEKFIRARDRILAQLLFANGVDLVAWRKRLGNFLGGIPRLDDVAGEQADEGFPSRPRPETC